MALMLGAPREYDLDPASYSISRVTIHNIDVTRSERTLLTEAILKQDLDTFRILLDMGANPNAPSYLDDSALSIWRWESPLVTATRKNQYEMVEGLLDAGAMVDSCDSSSYKTPLYWACSKDYSSLAKLLIRRGANVNCRNIHSETPIVEALVHKNMELVGLLLQHGLDLDGLITFDRDTPLIFALLVGQLQVADLMLQAGADPNKMNRCSEGALSVAISHFGNPDMRSEELARIVAMLLAAGVNVKPEDLQQADSQRSDDRPFDRRKVEFRRHCPHLALVSDALSCHRTVPDRLQSVAIRCVRTWLLALTSHRNILSHVDNLPLPNGLKQCVKLQTVHL